MSDRLQSQLRDKLLEGIRARARQAWDDLDELARVEVREALEDVAAIQLMYLGANDEERVALDAELRYARARLTNWEFVGADQIRDALRAALHEAAELLGALYRGLLK